MELDPDKIAAATDAVLDDAGEVIKDGVADASGSRAAKTQMKPARVKQLQTREDIGESMATDFITTGDPHFSDRYVERDPGGRRPTSCKARGEEILRPQPAADDGACCRRSTSAPPACPRPRTCSAGRADDAARRTSSRRRRSSAVELPNGTILLPKRISTSPLVVDPDATASAA